MDEWCGVNLCGREVGSVEIVLQRFGRLKTSRQGKAQVAEDDRENRFLETCSFMRVGT